MAQITFAKIAGGDWGVRGPVALLVPGAQVHASRRDESLVPVTIARVVETSRGEALAEIRRGHVAFTPPTLAPAALFPSSDEDERDADEDEHPGAGVLAGALERATRERDDARRALDLAQKDRAAALTSKAVAHDAIEAARVKIKGAGFESLDALIAALQAARRPSPGKAALDADTVRKVLEASAKHLVREGLAAFAGLARQETAEEYAARVAGPRGPRQIELDDVVPAAAPVNPEPVRAPRAIELDDAPSFTTPGLTRDAPGSPVIPGDREINGSPAPLPKLEDAPAAPVAPQLPSGVRARLAARRAKTKGGVS